MSKSQNSLIINFDFDQSERKISENIKNEKFSQRDPIIWPRSSLFDEIKKMLKFAFIIMTYYYVSAMLLFLNQHFAKNGKKISQTQTRIFIRVI